MSGWGKNEEKESPKYLHFHYTHRLPKSVCQNEFHLTPLYDGTYCSSNEKWETNPGEQLTSGGDSGGPYVCLTNDEVYIDGAVHGSHKQSEAPDAKELDVATDVVKFREWIDPFLVNTYVRTACMV